MVINSVFYFGSSPEICCKQYVLDYCESQWLPMLLYGGTTMDAYTVIKKGKNIMHCLDVPSEFLDQDLEITIKPIRKQGKLRAKIESLFQEMPKANPFKAVSDPVKWQKEQRSDW